MIKKNIGQQSHQIKQKQTYSLGFQPIHLDFSQQQSTILSSQIKQKIMLRLQNRKAQLPSPDNSHIQRSPQNLDNLHFNSQMSTRLPPHQKSNLEQQSVTSKLARTISKMIKIEFQENTQKPNYQVQHKRKVFYSAEKMNNRKKQNLSLTQRKQDRQKQEKIIQSNLAIGSRAIQKIDYTMSAFPKDFKFIEDNFTLRRRLKPYLHNLSEMRTTNLKQETGHVLILKINETNRLEELLFKPSKTGRTFSHSKRQHHKQRAFSSNPNRTGKNYIIDQFIPVRKASSKREPFVFGLNEKQPFPEKQRQKLLKYHDFLWKINYSNSLYVKATEPDITYKAFIGSGNNSNLIKNILKRRYWWNIVDKAEGSNFAWTQLKINSIFKQQAQSNIKVADIYKNCLMQDPPVTETINESQQAHERIFNAYDLTNWNIHFRTFKRSQAILTEKTYKNRAGFLNCKDISRIQHSEKLVLHNHIEHNQYIGNKKSLFYHIKHFYTLQHKDPFQIIPLTFHIGKGIEDPQFKLLEQTFQKLQTQKKNNDNLKNIWIMKPGENSNRGNGITICYHLDDIVQRLRAKEKNSDGSLRTFIVQKYIEKPLLFKGRKFDIRHYALITSFNGVLKAYWFPEGYLRTSSSPYSLKRGTSRYVHLTNDAVQKHADEYGKFQQGNKISYQKFQHYLDKSATCQKKYFYNQILPKMKAITRDAVKSTCLSLAPNKKQHNFELLGLDFMIDQELTPWLIEVNTNPCLEISSPLLAKIIPALIEQTFRICVDPFFPPPEEWPTSKKMYVGDNLLQQNEFSLIFDESVDLSEVISVMGSNLQLAINMGKIQQDVQIFQNDGAEQLQQSPI